MLILYTNGFGTHSQKSEHLRKQVFAAWNKAKINAIKVICGKTSPE
jgi:hypothetical protein